MCRTWDKYEQFEESVVCDDKDARLIDIFEAGADAMLEGLRKDGIKWGDVKELGAKWMNHVDSNETGYLVFIPDD